jgi:hypothetical protein
MTNRSEYNPILSLSELPNVDTARINLITFKLQEMREIHQQEFTKQIYNILIFQIHNFLNELSSDLNSQNEVKELLLILQNTDELQLQFEYFNWLFIKIINYKQKVILPSNNKELKGLSTSFYNVLGNHNFQFAQKINQAFENKTLTLHQLQLAFTEHLIQSEPNNWELCPDSIGMRSFRAKHLIENPDHTNYEDDE